MLTQSGMTAEEIKLAFQPVKHSKELIAVKLLYIFFYNWTPQDKRDLLSQAPNKNIQDDINYVFNEKFPTNEKTILKLGGLSNCLMSEFFWNLNQDTAEYVLEFACQKNKGRFIF